MTTRSLAVLLTAAVLLTGYVVLFEQDPPPGTGQGRVFRGLEPSAIVEVEVSRPAMAAGALAGVDVRPIRLQRLLQTVPGAAPSPSSSGDWWIVEPIRFEAFHPRIQAIVYDIADLARIADVPREEDVFPSGVEVLVRFRTHSGKEHTIEIGKEHPEPKLDFAYVRVDGATIVTRRSFRTGVWVTLEELRSRALFDIAPRDAAALAVRGEKSFEKRFQRDGDSRWRLKEPLDALADRELLETLLTDLNAWTASSFETDAAGPGDLARCGLDPPRATISLGRQDGREVTLQVGKDAGGDVGKDPPGDDAKAGGGAPPGTVYVRHEGQPFIMTAPADPLKLALAAPEELRTRYVFDLGLDEVDELEGEYEGVTVMARRIAPRQEEPGKVAGSRKGEKAAPGEAWEVRRTADSDPIPGDSQDIVNAVVSLRRLLIQKFLPAPLGEMKGRIRLLTRGGRTHELVLGPISGAAEDRGLNMVLAASPGEPGSYLVSTLLPSRLRAGPDAFRKRSLSDLDPARLIEVGIVDGSETWMMMRIPGESWSLSDDTQPLEGKTLSSAAVDRLLACFHRDRLRVNRYLADLKDGDPASLEAQGLSLISPRKAVLFLRFDGEGSRIGKFVVGPPVEGAQPPETRARVDLPDTPPFTLEDGVRESFDALVRHLREITGK